MKRWTGRWDKEKGEIETEKNGKRSKIIIKKKGRQKQRYYLWEEKDNYSEWVRARDEKTDRWGNIEMDIQREKKRQTKEEEERSIDKNNFREADRKRDKDTERWNKE